MVIIVYSPDIGDMGYVSDSGGMCYVSYKDGNVYLLDEGVIVFPLLLWVAL